ncbi:hypothetical protein [Aidingimonas halophila]|uniref:Beta-barrel assembly machine subunit BamC n=1 Tax=Aidingimonas halophila TaxID=574349 RepID=A0A1H2Z4M0_9GAMM|nr:hypothetical protein [Aidingimonas halophila]GHC15348.1 hypothetical protein GCM10008094_00340 [Aidingimonas halophila]SDX12306.1 hypothetical protein SAMN05443545_10438 [Aidingimonas halophila]
MKGRFLIPSMLLMLAVTGCTTTPLPEQPRAQVMAVDAGAALQEAALMFADKGYVVRYADADLGRIDAERIGRPAYRVRLEVVEQGDRVLVSFSGRRGSQPIDPVSFDPLLAELQARLGRSP